MFLMEAFLNIIPKSFTNVFPSQKFSSFMALFTSSTFEKREVLSAKNLYIYVIPSQLCLVTYALSN